MRLFKMIITGNMRRYQCPGTVPKRMPLRERFGIGNIQPGFNSAAVQNADKGIGIHGIAPSDIEQYRTALHFEQPLFVHQSAAFCTVRQSKRNNVRIRKQVIQCFKSVQLIHKIRFCSHRTYLG